MTHLTTEMVIARSKQTDLDLITKLNCWGLDLSDVSIIKRMPGIEILSLSVNNISTLKPFEDCLKLQELYLRKNKIQNIGEISYLQKLPALKHLWLEDNPCCDKVGKNYRSIVLRTLPNLQKLDNVEVTDEEVHNALHTAAYEDATELQQNQQQYEQHHKPATSSQRPASAHHLRKRGECEEHQQHHDASVTLQHSYLPRRTGGGGARREINDSFANRDDNTRENGGGGAKRKLNDRFTHRADNTRENGGGGAKREIDYRLAHRDDNTRKNGGDGARREMNDRFAVTYSSRRHNAHNGYSAPTVLHAAPKRNRNSNLLSATLLLINLLDYSSLEVVGHEVRCRIDELSSQ